MTENEVATALGTRPEQIRKSKGQFRYHVSYYWDVTKSAHALMNWVKEKLPQAEIIDSGNHYHDFVGGAKSGSPKDSFLWVTFKIS